MIISNLQSNILKMGLKSGIRKKYEDWHKMLLLGLKDYAAKMGLKEIWITTADHQMKQWSNLHPKTAFEVYGKIPLEMGFTLKETQPTNVEGINSKLFWVRKVDQHKGEVEKNFESIISEDRETKLNRLKTMIVKHKKES
jgi:hypothetical protein